MFPRQNRLSFNEPWMKLETCNEIHESIDYLIRYFYQSTELPAVVISDLIWISISDFLSYIKVFLFEVAYISCITLCKHCHITE